MNAAAPTAVAAASPFVVLPLASVTASKTNPRKRFDETALRELAESVKAHGIIQPVLARPLAKGYEIVAGERRLRAARLAGLVEIPAIVRELSDTQTLELQVIENLQREDLHELEEAEGYEALLKCKKSDDGKVYDVDAIAAKVGKSRSYVYQRLKLLALCPEARKAFFDGQFPAAIALPLARISPESEQKRFLKAFDQRAKHGGMSFRDALDLIHREFMLALKDAPFDPKDATLVPQAGSCTDCPKRTGNQPELFPDVTSTDVCSDPRCFQAKKAAHVTIVTAKAEATGQKVISGKAAQELTNNYNDEISSGDYIEPNQKCWDDAKQRTYKAILGKDAPTPTIIVHPRTGDALEAWPRKEIAPILKEKGIGARRTESDTKARAQQKAQKQKAVLERQARRAVFDQVHVAIAGMTPQLALVIARWAYDTSGFEAKRALVVLWGWVDAESTKEVGWEELRRTRAKLDALTPAELTRFLVDCATIDEANGEAPAELLNAAATALGLDAKAIAAAAIKVAKAELPATAKPKPKKAKAAKAKKAA